LYTVNRHTLFTYAEYIVQGHRFNIYEEIGCFPATYDTPVAYPLVYCWPIAIGLISAIYCSEHSIPKTLLFYIYSSLALTIRTLTRRRSELKQFLSSGSNLNSGYYFRLMGLVSIELLLTVPLGSYILYLNLQGLNPWRGWSDTHLRFSHVRQYPSLIWKSSHFSIVELELTRWSAVICAFVCFAFFGFTDDARKNYRITLNAVCKKIGYGMDSGSVRHEAPHVMEFARQASSLRTSTDYSGTPLHSVKIMEPYGSTELLPEPLKHISVYFVPPSLSQPEPALNLALNPRHSADAPGPVRPNVMPVVEREGKIQQLEQQSLVKIDNDDMTYATPSPTRVCPS
jgi:Pheromone A receptor